MSLARMNMDERASYFMGQAILRMYRDTATASPERSRDFEAIDRCMITYLTPEEFEHVVPTTGILFGGDEPRPARPRTVIPFPGKPDPDIPF